MTRNILIVDDEPVQTKMLEKFIKDNLSYNVMVMTDGQQVVDFFVDKVNNVNRLAPKDIDVMLLDLSMPIMSGMEVLKRIYDIKGDLQIIVLTSAQDISLVVNAIDFGAIDYIVKGEKDVFTRVIASINNACEKRTLKSQVYHLQRKSKNQMVFSDIIGTSPEFVMAVGLAKKVTTSTVPVLIEGPSGTGKEMMAKVIHGSGPRSGKPFVTINCAELKVNNASEILFGYERRSDDGMVEKSIGKVREAQDGTLFFDNIGELKIDIQVKLLRFLQDGQFQPAGSKLIYKSNARIISSSNQFLADLVRKKKFREDLLYRLNIFPIRLPSLAERGAQDLQLLAESFCHEASVNENKKIKGLSDNALKLLLNYEWEDNIRQLQHYIFRAVVLCDDEYLEPKHFPQIIMIDNQPVSVAKLANIIKKPQANDSEIFDIFDENGNCKSLEDIEYEVVQRLHNLYDGNLSEISKKLKVSRSTIYRKLDMVNKNECNVQEG